MAPCCQRVGPHPGRGAGPAGQVGRARSAVGPVDPDRDGHGQRRRRADPHRIDGPGQPVRPGPRGHTGGRRTEGDGQTGQRHRADAVVAPDGQADALEGDARRHRGDGPEVADVDPGHRAATHGTIASVGVRQSTSSIRSSTVPPRVVRSGRSPPAVPCDDGSGHHLTVERPVWPRPLLILEEEVRQPASPGGVPGGGRRAPRWAERTPDGASRRSPGRCRCRRPPRPARRWCSARPG